jgi:hypothetical protein
MEIYLTIHEKAALFEYMEKADQAAAIANMRSRLSGLAEESTTIAARAKNPWRRFRHGLPSIECLDHVGHMKASSRQIVADAEYISNAECYGASISTILKCGAALQKRFALHMAEIPWASDSAVGDDAYTAEMEAQFHFAKGMKSWPLTGDDCKGWKIGRVDEAESQGLTSVYGRWMSWAKAGAYVATKDGKSDIRCAADDFTTLLGQICRAEQTDSYKDQTS